MEHLLLDLVLDLHLAGDVLEGRIDVGHVHPPDLLHFHLDFSSVVAHSGQGHLHLRENIFQTSLV